MGMIVTAFTTSGATRAEELKKLGADYICDSKDLEKLKKEHSKYDILLNCLYIEDNAEQFRVISILLNAVEARKIIYQKKKYIF